MEGAQIGPYRVLGDLGSGGMGKVYLAEVAGHAPGLDDGCRVALKVIHPHLLETPGFFKRFLREAEIGKSVEQDNVVRCFDCDALLVDGHQQHFLVMEYVEGQTLRDLLNELERVPEELCRHIGREIAKGLVAIHDAGVIHRDLKPENVLITDEHVVKVMDLGVARLQDEAIRLSQTGAFVGSLEYAAPEQFRSADGEPDGRADLHALGVVLYELATGQHPYRDEDAGRVIGRILNDQPRKAGEVNPQLSAFFEEVVHTLIAKDREQRFPSSSTLASVLDEGEKSGWWKERAKALRVETQRPLRRIRIPRETALYGRDDDLAKLHALYERAKAGDGRVLLIEGEAGIGKTRLVDEFAGRLRQEGEDINFLFGSYPPGGAATASGAFSEAYREQFGAEGLGDALTEYLKPTPILIPAFAAILRGETTPTGAEPLTKDSLQTVFVHATRGLAAERTTIVLIDDLHFAPEDGRALFSSLAMAVPGHRILLVGTMRPGVPEDWTAGITRLDHAELWRLSRLGPKDLFRLLKDSFRSDRLAEELGLQISVKCDGNPFFAFEIIRGLREGQFIAQQPDGTWVTTKIIQDIQVPSSVLDLVNARVADLTEEERDLLDVAACCGFEFDAGLVGDALGLARIPSLKRFATIEKKHRLVRCAGERFVFDHHQVQEALYDALPPPLAREYHSAVGTMLEARSGAGSRDPKAVDGALCVDLCGHFLKGGSGERSIRYLHPALEHLRHGYANAQAVVLADRALTVPDLLLGEDRVKVLYAKFWRLQGLARYEEQAGTLSEMRRLVESLGDRRSMSRVHQAAGSLASCLSRHEEAIRACECGLELNQAIGDRLGEGYAWGGVAKALYFLGRNTEALERYERALEIAQEVGDSRLEREARYGLGMVCEGLSRYEEAEAHSTQVVAAARAAGDRFMEALGVGQLGNVQYARGRYDEARAYYEQSHALHRGLGSRLLEAQMLVNLGNVDSGLGRYAEAHARFSAGLRTIQELGDRYSEAALLTGLGIVAYNRGRYAEAEELNLRCLDLARRTGARRVESVAAENLGLVERAMGRYADALEHYELARVKAAEAEDRRVEAAACDCLGDLWGALGRYAAAQECLAHGLEIAREIGDRQQESRCLLHTAAAAEPAGDGTEALTRYETMLSVLAKVGDRLELARAGIAYGRALRSQGHTGRAEVQVRKALSLARELELPGVVSSALCDLAALPGGDLEAARTALLDNEEVMAQEERLACRFLLWQLTSDATHLQEAKRILDRLVEHAPEEHRESMLKNVRLNREIMEAWAEHGDAAAKEAVE